MISPSDGSRWKLSGRENSLDVVAIFKAIPFS